MRIRRHLPCLALLLLVPVAACDEPDKTAAVLIVELDIAIPGVDQFEITAQAEGDASPVEFKLPENPERIDVNPVRLLLVLPDHWGGKRVRIGIVGRFLGRIEGHARVAFVPERKEVTEVNISLRPGTPQCDGRVAEGTEQCDGGDLDGQTCLTAAGIEGGTLRCTDECRLDLSGCAACGNGILEPTEQCDGLSLGGRTCASMGFAGEGTISCLPNCQFDVSDCKIGCGNGIVDAPGDECDASDFAGQTCRTVRGLDQGQLRCLPSCRIDSSGCFECGNDSIEADEECDGQALAGQTCESLGFVSGGILRCDANCRIDTSSCTNGICGNGQVDAPGEECDGGDFGGHTCVTRRGLAQGQLQCTNTCRIDSSGCYECGNGSIEADEECDDGALAFETCFTMTGATSGELLCRTNCTYDISQCVYCGNSMIDGSENCDDGNADSLDGCSAACLEEPGWSCTGQPSVCTPVCGDGLIRGGEECDDGGTGTGDGCDDSCRIEPNYGCEGEPSICGPATCDGNVREPGEECDGNDLGGETCLSLGYRMPAANALACNPGTCTFNTSGCGAEIDNEGDVAGALVDAWTFPLAGRRHVISVRPSPSATAIAVTQTILVDECSGACGSAPQGVEVQPLGGAAVCLRATGAFPIFTVRSGNNEFRNLCVVDATTGYLLDNTTPAESGGNRITHHRFVNGAIPPASLIHVRSAGNTIEKNQLATNSAGGFGIEIDGVPDNDILQNAVSGPFAWGIHLHGYTGPIDASNVSFVDHNSLHVTGGGGGINLTNFAGYCYRNNIIWGDLSGTGIHYENSSSGADTQCAFPNTGNNLTANHNVLCEGTCTVACPGPGVANFCDLTAPDPGFIDEGLCLRPTTHPLVDAAFDFTFSAWASYPYVTWDDGPTPYAGAAPDVGARDSGTTRVFGGALSSCP